MSSSLREAYENVSYLSIKYDSYFDAYEELLAKYRGKEITLVEIGVFNGGSLFMWREFLGPSARVIGVDLNPDAKIWEKHGFEVYIGDQADERFLRDLFQNVGPVDVVIDDGGHTNLQQIATTHIAVTHIRDGGLLIVEDVHTSYFREFGNPWRRSFVNFAYWITDCINSRAFALRTMGTHYSSRVHRVSFFESIVAFHINATLCKKSTPTTNNGISQKASDFRYQGVVQSYLFSLKNRISATRSGVPRIVARIMLRGVDVILSFFSRLEATRGAKYWRDDIK